MKLRFRHAIRCMLLGLGFISLRVGAVVDVSRSPSGANANNGSSQAVGLFSLELGLLIGAVFVVLVVVLRNRNAP